MKADHWKNLLGLVRLLTESSVAGFKIRRTCLPLLKFALDFLPRCERGKYLKPILHGCAALRVICKCTRFGAMEQPRSRKWRRRPLREDMNTLQSQTTLKDSRLPAG